MSSTKWPPSLVQVKDRLKSPWTCDYDQLIGRGEIACARLPIWAAVLPVQHYSLVLAGIVRA